jgi:hypothetical protein
MRLLAESGSANPGIAERERRPRSRHGTAVPDPLPALLDKIDGTFPKPGGFLDETREV